MSNLNVEISSDVEDDERDLIPCWGRPRIYFNNYDKIIPSSKRKKLNNAKEERNPFYNPNTNGNFSSLNIPMAVFVVDLDETLIDDRYKPFPNSDQFLINLHKRGPLILWTAGNKEHVLRYQKSIYIWPFARVLTKLYKCTKSVSQIKQYCPAFITSNVPIILIDDNVNNLKTSGYDITINCQKFYFTHAETSKYSINYTKMLEVIDKEIHDWQHRRQQIQSSSIARNNDIVEVSSDNE
uniref:Putative ORF19 n=1 Tax=Drosophila-associated filamentous virus TaxID=2743186 RepID=A0A6M9TZW8_9VIRU|nr:putative ORF19 [Drosophila-associated filamentous virus]